jgi:hypothetical protein
LAYQPRRNGRDSTTVRAATCRAGQRIHFANATAAALGTCGRGATELFTNSKVRIHSHTIPPPLSLPPNTAIAILIDIAPCHHYTPTTALSCPLVPSHRISASTRVTSAESSSPASSHSELIPSPTTGTSARSILLAVTPHYLFAIVAAQLLSDLAYTSTAYFARRHPRSLPTHHISHGIHLPMVRPRPRSHHSAHVSTRRARSRPARHDRGYSLPCYARLPLVVPQISQAVLTAASFPFH